MFVLKVLKTLYFACRIIDTRYKPDPSVNELVPSSVDEMLRSHPSRLDVFLWQSRTQYQQLIHVSLKDE